MSVAPKKKKKTTAAKRPVMRRGRSETPADERRRPQIPRSQSAESLAGRELLSMALRVRFGDGSRTTWPSERFCISARTADVERAACHVASATRLKDVLVCSTVFTPRPPRQLTKLEKVMRASAAPIVDEPNAGGSSDQSEMVSFAMVKVLFDARLLATEMAVTYDWANSKKIDYLCAAGDTRLGVSVTRAYRHQATFDEVDALHLLVKKLHGLWKARTLVCDRHAWDLGVLHIWCHSATAADLIAKQLQDRRNRAVWPLRLFDLANMPPPLVILTVTSSIDHVIFHNAQWRDVPRDVGRRFVDARRRAARTRQAQYAALAPHRWAPPAVPARLAYFR